MCFCFDLNAAQWGLVLFNRTCWKISPQFKMCFYVFFRTYLWWVVNIGQNQMAVWPKANCHAFSVSSLLMRYFLRLLSLVWGTAVGQRCYPRSPPKNHRPCTTAPQILNRSIRHTMLRAAGVWACGFWCLSCLMARDMCIIARAHSQLHTTLQKLFYASSLTVRKQIHSIVVNVYCYTAEFCGQWPFSIIFDFATWL